MLLFKYVSPDAITKIFDGGSELSIRFGLPKTYNDPYELFLEPATTLQDEEERAFYNYFLGQVTQAPVSCFSKRPDSVVMWAHYGRDGTGICMAFDEDTLVRQFSLSYIADIAYSDHPAKLRPQILEWAFTTGKRRHTLLLLAVGHRAAYFVKRSDWQYEAERRIVTLPDAVENRKGILVGKVNPRALRYIIVGPKVDAGLKEICEEHARRWKTPVIELRIGRRTFEPFFAGAEMPTAVWSGVEFQKVVSVCGVCAEPADLVQSGRCQWCDISDEARQTGPSRSLLALTLAEGVETGIPLEFDGLEPKGYSAPKHSGASRRTRPRRRRGR
jgi:hypothetical protein